MELEKWLLTKGGLLLFLFVVDLDGREGSDVYYTYAIALLLVCCTLVRLGNVVLLYWISNETRLLYDCGET